MESEAAKYVLIRVKDKYGFRFNKSYSLEAGNNEIIIINHGADAMIWIPDLGELIALINEQAALFGKKVGNMQIYPHVDNLRAVISLK